MLACLLPRNRGKNINKTVHSFVEHVNKYFGNKTLTPILRKAENAAMKHVCSFFILLLACFNTSAQTFEMMDGDTINLTDADGKKQGFWRYFWSNGDLKYEVFYENNEKEGLEIRYYD